MDGMDENLCDDMFDALALAKKAFNLLPPLPPHFKPVYMRVLKAIARVRDENRLARVSDINAALGGLLPNTTKLLNELVPLGVVTKQSLETDRRVVLVQASPLGEQYIHDYIEKYNAAMLQAFWEIGENKCRAMMNTVAEVYHAIQKTYQ